MTFVVKANTAEEMRAEIVKDLEQRAIREGSAFNRSATLRDKSVAHGRFVALENLARFYKDLVIEPREVAKDFRWDSKPSGVFVQLTEQMIVMKKSTLTIILPDSSLPVTVEVTSAPSLEKMQESVGGFVGPVDRWFTFFGAPVQVYCNEEGRLHGLPVNHIATLWLRESRPRWRKEPPLVGPIVVLAGLDAVWK